MQIKKFINKTTKNKKSIDKGKFIIYNVSSIMENYLARVSPFIDFKGQNFARKGYIYGRILFGKNCKITKNRPHKRKNAQRNATNRGRQSRFTYRVL